ncbi:MAG: biotin--[acetyl-CoA-carboxylase] ligase [Bacteroidota bacterium]
MHKIFAKPLFLGKHIVYLPECQSTNEIASKMAATSELLEGSVIITDKQTDGRGQRGNTWVTEAGKNLTFSLFLKPSFLKISEQFNMTMIISLAVREVFEKFSHSSQVQIKWPNDVYIADRKCAGILIENSLKGNKLEEMVVGIGMNINQGNFHVSQATSLFGETGAEFELRDVLEETLIAIEKYYLQLKNSGLHAIRSNYLSKLMWKDEWHIFEAAGKAFNGKILGVDQIGRLIVEKDKNQYAFDIKEISFLK